jgi:motility quorum-sensing regulator/GCU-specific mRNA interferase toxin
LIYFVHQFVPRFNEHALLDDPEMLAVIAGLTRRDFYKSMTTYADSRVWQDVYYAMTPVKKEAYIKITRRDVAPIIQFKEK